MSSAHSHATPRMTTAVRILLCGAAVATVAHGMFTVFGVGKPGLNDIFNEWLYDVVIVAGRARVPAQGHPGARRPGGLAR